MAKEKKITVGFFPRKRNFKNSYTIYFRVLYNRKSTMISTHIDIKAKSLDEAKKIVEKEASKYNSEKLYLNYKPEKIINLIKEEIRIKGDQYSVIGFGERWNFYLKPMIFIFGDLLLVKLLKKLQDVLTFKKYNDIRRLIDLKKQDYKFTEYKIFFYVLDLLKNNYDLNIDNLVDDEIFNIASTARAFRQFDGIFIQDSKESGEAEKEVKSFFSANSIHFYTTLDWLTNEQKIKTKFMNFLKEKHTKKTEQEVDSQFIKVFPEKKYSNNSEMIFLSLSQLVEDQVRSL